MQRHDFSLSLRVQLLLFLYVIAITRAAMSATQGVLCKRQLSFTDPNIAAATFMCPPRPQRQCMEEVTVTTGLSRMQLQLIFTGEYD